MFHRRFSWGACILLMSKRPAVVYSLLPLHALSDVPCHFDSNILVHTITLKHDIIVQPIQLTWHTHTYTFIHTISKVHNIDHLPSNVTILIHKCIVGWSAWAFACNPNCFQFRTIFILLLYVFQCFILKSMSVKQRP